MTSLNDKLAEGLAPEADAAFEAERSKFWQNRLSEASGHAAELHNAHLYLTQHELWQGVLAFDSFSQRIIKRAVPPFQHGKVGEWTDADDLRTTVWLHSNAAMPKISTGTVVEAVRMASEDNAYHPVQEYLESLTWDGVERVETWLEVYAGAARPVTKSAHYLTYLYNVGRMWMISAVARILKPGCKVDTVLIIEGQQGIGKSTAAGILGGDWHLDTPLNLNDKDAYQSVQGKWLVELAELDSLNKAEATRAKAFFSSSEDYYRPSYGRRAEKFPRQCVFFGTTNQHEYLRDSTGARRFWPVYSRGIDTAALQRDRDQLWAEAVHLFKQNERWWVPKDNSALQDIFDEQASLRQIHDPWQEIILDWLNDPTRRALDRKIYMNEILTGALDFDANRLGERVDAIRVGKIMNAIGYIKRESSSREDRRRARFYYQLPQPGEDE